MGLAGPGAKTSKGFAAAGVLAGGRSEKSASVPRVWSRPIAPTIAAGAEVGIGVEAALLSLGEVLLALGTAPPEEEEGAVSRALFEGVAAAWGCCSRFGGGTAGGGNGFCLLARGGNPSSRGEAVVLEVVAVDNGAFEVVAGWAAADGTASGMDCPLDTR